MALLVLGSALPIGQRALGLLRVIVLMGVLLGFSRKEIAGLRVRHWVTSIALGIGVFALWVGPDLFLPAWRDNWLFSNGLTGRVEGTLPEPARSDLMVLVLRSMRAVILVPIVEELFWRGWLPRWLDRMEDFRQVPLGQFSRAAFWLTALLFASEHGSMWDVGLAAGLLYNFWMRRTRSLGDLVLAHAVTNACLSAYVVLQGRWEYW